MTVSEEVACFMLAATFVNFLVTLLIWWKWIASDYRARFFEQAYKDLLNCVPTTTENVVALARHKAWLERRKK